jgi:hypothetical protein
VVQLYQVAGLAAARSGEAGGVSASHDVAKLGKWRAPIGLASFFRRTTCRKLDDEAPTPSVRLLRKQLEQSCRVRFLLGAVGPLVKRFNLSMLALERATQSSSSSAGAGAQMIIGTRVLLDRRFYVD